MISARDSQTDGQTESIVADTALCIEAMLSRSKNPLNACLSVCAVLVSLYRPGTFASLLNSSVCAAVQTQDQLQAVRGSFETDGRKEISGR